MSNSYKNLPNYIANNEQLNQFINDSNLHTANLNDFGRFIFEEDTEAWSFFTHAQNWMNAKMFNGLHFKVLWEKTNNGFNIWN